MKEINIEELQENPFKMIGKDWLLITAQKDGKANTMTASWGGLGVIWGKILQLFIFVIPDLQKNLLIMQILLAFV
ncbi:MAG: hypothetical protein J6C25_03750 [Treponema sp.]|nr:hypothetical protein [Treponema sp.]MBP3561974.1 hypothetical protein [Treponema sp.]